MLGLLIRISADPGYLDIRRGAVIPKLLWKDNTFKKNLEIVSVSQTHVVLREGNNYITIRHEHLLSLHETTHQNLTSAKINQAANNLGGAKPGIASKWHIEPGYIFNKLLWTDGREKRLVEVLNIRKGYYVLRMDSRTTAISQEKFLKILENTKAYLAEDPDIAVAQSKPQKKNPFLAQPAPAPPKLKPKPESASVPVPAKTTKSALGAPPPPPASLPPSKRPIQFDFKFAGDTVPPTIDE